MPYQTNKLLAVLLILLVFVCCRKKPAPVQEEIIVNTEMKNGLPADPKKINGYLFAGHLLLSASNYTALNMFASFADPQKNLIAGYDHLFNSVIFNLAKSGNIDVGEVSFLSMIVHKNLFSNSLSYSTQNSTQVLPPFQAAWVTEGNRSFDPLNLTVPRGLPVNNVQSTADTLSISQNYIFDVSQHFSNYDSAMVMMYYGGAPWSLVPKRAGAETGAIKFFKEDFSGITPHTSGYMYYYAFNYSHQVISDKMYVFELAAKKIRLIYFVP